jgi:hypothetical protein
MSDIDTMTNRERTAGLMRGNSGEMRLGYGARSAAYAALDYARGFKRDVPPDDPELINDLIPYAEGFADGMAIILSPDERVPNEVYVMHQDAPAFVRTPPYDDGMRDAFAERPGDHLHPALERKPEPDLIQRFPERGGASVTRAEPEWANATDEELKAEAERRARGLP